MLFSLNNEASAIFVNQFYDFIYKTETFCCRTTAHSATLVVKSCTPLGDRSFTKPGKGNVP
mgnify:CR=1 FL=1